MSRGKLWEEIGLLTDGRSESLGHVSVADAVPGCPGRRAVGGGRASRQLETLPGLCSSLCWTGHFPCPRSRCPQHVLAPSFSSSSSANVLPRATLCLFSPCPTGRGHSKHVNPLVGQERARGPCLLDGVSVRVGPANRARKEAASEYLGSRGPRVCHFSHPGCSVDAATGGTHGPHVNKATNTRDGRLGPMSVREGESSPAWPQASRLRTLLQGPL